MYLGWVVLVCNISSEVLKGLPLKKTRFLITRETLEILSYRAKGSGTSPSVLFFTVGTDIK